MRKHFAILIAIAGLATAQAPTAFEVATIKPSDPDARRVSIGTGPGGRFVARNITLRALIAEAYNLRDDRVIGSESLDAKHFDIDAKPSVLNPPFDQIRLMLQSLLADRFRLTIHHETRQLPAYFLAVDKSGSKIKATRAPLETDDETGIRRDGKGKLTAMKASINLFTDAITRDLGKSVIDETGLKGYYDFTLEWTPDSPAAAELPGGPSIFTAIREQLGLKLDERKAPADVIVIDHIQYNPTEN